MSRKTLLISALLIAFMALAWASNHTKSSHGKSVNDSRKTSQTLLNNATNPSGVSVIYSTDFEKAGEWSAVQLGTTGPIFQWVQSKPHSPTHSWWVPDDTTMSSSGIQIETAIVSPVINLPAKIDGYAPKLLKLSYWADVETPNTNAGGSIYDFFETEIFTPYEGDNFWHTDTLKAYGSSGKSWWCGNAKTRTYGVNWRQEVWTPVLNLSGAAQPIRLNFKNAPSSEPSRDFCHLEISSDGGATWTRLARWDEQHTNVDWFEASYDISAYASAATRIRWRFESDHLTAAPNGWRIDNVEVTNSTTRFLFDDGGDTAASLIPQEHPLSWNRMSYDYDDGRKGNTWFLVDNSTIFNGSLNLLKYVGFNVRFRIKVKTDGYNRLRRNSGYGFYFDDFQIVGEGNTPPAAITDLAVTSTTFTSISLRWTTPEGTTRYDLRYSATPITEANWDSLRQATNEPTPSSAGMVQLYTLAGLLPNTLYYIAMRSTNTSVDPSKLSNIITARTREVIIPADIRDLSVTSISSSSIGLAWTAPRGATAYDMRYFTRPITAANWDSTFKVANEPAPLIGGSVHNYTLIGLSATTVYYIAIASADSIGRWWGMSNVVSTRTNDLVSSDWRAETVSGSYFSQLALALNDAGNLSMAYGGNTLAYAQYDGNSWRNEIVVERANVGNLNLTMGKNNAPHLCYYDDSEKRLKYAFRSGSSWQTVAIIAEAGRQRSALALNGQGLPHLSYYDNNRKELKYAFFDGTSWQTQTVVAGDQVYDNPALGLDSQGKPHIYYFKSNRELKYAALSGSSWQVSALPSPSQQFGAYAAIAVDNQGRPHVTYFTFTETCDLFDFVCIITGPTLRNLYHAYFSGTNWTVASINSPTGSENFLFLDNSGNPYIIYHKGVRECVNFVPFFGCLGTAVILKSTDFAYKKGTSWQRGTLATPNRSGLFIWDKTNQVHQVQFSGEAITHSVFNGSSWKGPATVDRQLKVGKYSSLALDRQGRPHISFYDENNADLKLASFNGSTWQAQTVDAMGNVGSYTSLTLNTNGYPRISYYDERKLDLKFAFYDGSSWRIQMVDSTGNVGKFTSLALNPNDQPAISYYDETKARLKYAFHDGSTWRLQVVDSTGNVGTHSSLALDGHGNPHVSYYDAAKFDLKFASYNGSAWRVQTVDSTDRVGKFSSLALDARGNPVVSYYDETNGDLKFASYQGTTWQIQTVDSRENVGTHTSLALSSKGKPVISYYDERNGELKIAYRDGTIWQLQTIDRGSAGSYNSLAMDAEDHIHVSYHNLPRGELKYVVNSTLRVDVENLSENSSNVPFDFSLLQNYPNPFNPETRIEYTLDKRRHITLSIYNIVGQLIYTLVDGEQNPGRYTAIWNGEDLRGRKVTSGIYFYMLKSESSEFRLRKMMLLK